MKNIISVVIVTRNRMSALERCLNSVYLYHDSVLEVIVVDNDSTDDTLKMLSKKFKRVKVVLSKKNSGAAGGRNLGAKNAKGDYLYFLDDDAYVGTGTFKQVLTTIQKDAKIAIVQSFVLSSFDKKKILGIAHDINTTTSLITAYGIGERDHGQYRVELDIPMVGTGWLIRTSVFKKIKGFDEKFFVPYEDSDLSLRVRMAGFRIVFNPKSKIWHDDLKPTEINNRVRSIGIASPERAFYVGRNKVYFMKKHSKGFSRFIFFSILLPLFVVYHSIIILSSGRVDVLGYYLKGLREGFNL